MTPRLRLNHITKAYPGIVANDDICLEVCPGEVLAILGENGAGKSTTLKMICGMLRPTAGEILFAGHAWRREDLYAIGSLIEEAPLYPNLTARENLRVRTTLLGLPESRIDEVLAAVDLADTGKKRAGRFSMGMRQRLGLALALIARPRLLVLDEPTNGLDPVVRDEVTDILLDFARDEEHSILISSHIVSDLEKLCDTIAFLHKGRLLLCEEKDALREEYALWHGTAAQLAALDVRVYGKRVTPYGAEALVRRDAMPAGAELAPVSIEELFVLMVKGECAE